MEQIWGSGNKGQKSKNPKTSQTCFLALSLMTRQITMNKKIKIIENTIHSTSNLSGTCSLGEGMPTK